MELDLLQHWQSTDLAFRIFVLTGVAGAYVLFELLAGSVGSAMKRKPRAG